MLVATFIACVFISSMNMTVGKVIGYPGLKPDLPCDHHRYPSACAPSEQPVNPYRRGCSKIHRCRRDSPPAPISRKMLIRGQLIYNNAYNAYIQYPWIINLWVWLCLSHVVLYIYTFTLIFFSMYYCITIYTVVKSCFIIQFCSI